MTTATLEKKVVWLEKEFKAFKTPKKIFPKLHVDKSMLTKAATAPFDFDIEKFVTKKDLEGFRH